VTPAARPQLSHSEATLELPRCERIRSQRAPGRSRHTRVLRASARVRPPQQKAAQEIPFCAPSGDNTVELWIWKR